MTDLSLAGAGVGLAVGAAIAPLVAALVARPPLSPTAQPPHDTRPAEFAFLPPLSPWWPAA